MLTVKEAEIKLNELIPNDIRLLSNLFKSNNHNLFLVGGAVRDVLLNKLPKDFDVATDANPDEIQKILIDADIKQQSQGVDFGVIVAKMSEDIEIATFRTDESNNSGEMKDISVKFGATIEEDVKRRDLTINGLFFDISNKQIIDLIGGIDDLKNGIIRTIGKPEDRFKEDNLRKLRAAVRSIKDNFTIEEKTLITIQNNPSLNISKERVFNELNKITNNFTKLHNILFETNLITTILPNLKINRNINNNISCLSTMFSVILCDNTISDIKKELNDLKFPTDIINNICFLINLINHKHFNLINPFMFFKNKKKTKLPNNTILQFFDNDKNINELLLFKPNKNVTESYINNGFSGKKLGDKIIEHYFINRKNIWK